MCANESPTARYISRCNPCQVSWCSRRRAARADVTPAATISAVPTVAAGNHGMPSTCQDALSAPAPVACAQAPTAAAACARTRTSTDRPIPPCPAVPPGEYVATAPALERRGPGHQHEQHENAVAGQHAGHVGEQPH